jgi:hypothetical protein
LRPNDFGQESHCKKIAAVQAILGKNRTEKNHNGANDFGQVQKNLGFCTFPNENVLYYSKFQKNYSPKTLSFPETFLMNH